MRISTQAGGQVESCHWHNDQDTMAAIEDSIRSGEMLSDDIEAEEVYTDTEFSDEDTSFDEAMEQSRMDWQLERELLRNFNSDIRSIRS